MRNIYDKVPLWIKLLGKKFIGLPSLAAIATGEEAQELIRIGSRSVGGEKGTVNGREYTIIQHTRT